MSDIEIGLIVGAFIGAVVSILTVLDLRNVEIRELSRDKAELQALADKLADALRDCADDLEAEVEARRGAVLERTTRRDLLPVVAAREALTAYQNHKG